MITQMFPKDFQRYLDLPVLGPLMDAYAAWLFEQQYTHRSSRYELRMAAHACKFLRSQGVHCVEDVHGDNLEACYQLFRRKFPKEAGSVRVLTRFLMEQAVVQPSPAPEPSPKDILVNTFVDHLRDDRGYASSTVQRQGLIISEFLDVQEYEEAPDRLVFLNVTDIDNFIQHMAKRMGRVALQKATSTLRHFLRFLSDRGVIPSGLERQIDTPRVYRQEQLPKALPWSTVQAFLHSIDRHTAIGKRDFAMFSLITTYGLRACDVVALKLNDVKWRTGRIQICQTKTSRPLELPLIDEVGSALYDYLNGVPRHGNYRQVFLRLKAPSGVLKSTAVTAAFQTWSIKSGLDIPYKGTHWLRHSCALNLCRQGFSLKIIGDLLGHRRPESTAVYIRLKTEDLRDVALNMPAPAKVHKEVQP